MPNVIINDDTFQDHLQPVIDGKPMSKGLIPRDFQSHPTGCFAAAPGFPDELLIPPSEQQAALDKQRSENASLLDLRNDEYETLQSLDQDGFGLCWAFSSTKATMYTRARMGLPPVKLSAWAVAGWVKGWQDQGGWGLQSVEMLAKRGAPRYDLCPQYKRSYDNPAMEQDALNHIITEWWDGDGNNNSAKRVQQMITMFLLGLAPVLDFNWWGHSVCGCRLRSINPLVIDIDNSWGASAGDKGIYTLQGSKAVPDGLVCPKLILPSNV